MTQFVVSKSGPHILKPPYLLYRFDLRFLTNADGGSDAHRLFVEKESVKSAVDCDNYLSAIKTLLADKSLIPAMTVTVPLEALPETLTSSDEHHWTERSRHVLMAINDLSALTPIANGDIFQDNHGILFAWIAKEWVVLDLLPEIKR